MAALRLKRGTTVQRLAYTPVESELIHDTDTDDVFIGDGATAGGVLFNGLVPGGVWAGNHKKDEVVREGDWLGYALVDTSDNLEPTEVGGVVNSIDPATTFNNVNDNSVVKMEHELTLTKSGFIKVIQVKLPVVTSDTVVRVSVVNISTGEATVVSPTLIAGEWTTLSINSAPAVIGTVFVVTLEVYNSNTSKSFGSVWANWDTATDPIDGYFSTDDINNPTYIWVDYQDHADHDFQALLDGVSVGSIMFIRDNSSTERSCTLSIDAIDTSPAGFVKYSVSVLSQGTDPFKDDRWCDLRISDPIALATDYLQVAAPLAPSFATFASKLFFDNVEQASATDAYGINVAFQEATMSPDWFIMAQSGGSTTPTEAPIYDFGEVTP